MTAAIQTTIRITQADLAEIDQNAQARAMTRTAFLIDSALKRLPEHTNTLEQRLEAIEQQLERHSRLLELATNNSY